MNMVADQGVHCVSFCNELLLVARNGVSSLFISRQMTVIFYSEGHYLNHLGTTLKCLSIGTPKTVNFPFVSNGK